jgi:transposase
MRAHIVFIDESGFLMSPLLRRSWAPRGATPILSQRTRSHEKISAIAAICVEPNRRRVKFYFSLHPAGNINSGLACSFLGNLKRQLRTPIALLWDRLQAHRSRKINRFISKSSCIKSFFFPGYAPELNPVEGVWAFLKTNTLANFAPEDINALRKATFRSGRALQTKELLLRSFLKHSGLSLRLQ